MTKLVFDSLNGLDQSFAALDLIPDTHAWVKDLSGHFTFGNSLFCQRFGLQDSEALRGKTDYDLAPRDMAERYRADDENALQGLEVSDRLELIGGADSVEWFLTSKWPIYNHSNQIIGSIGISRHLNRSETKAAPFQQLSAPIDYIRQHFASDISVADLARASSLSVSALERRFRKHLDKTPHQYLNEVRLGHGRSLLINSDKAIGNIALETGFADHSHFTRAYKKHFGIAPKAERIRTMQNRT
ncbi:MAG: helix-turn-helix domain-containing protein [Halioglobus sp.]